MNVIYLTGGNFYVWGQLFDSCCYGYCVFPENVYNTVPSSIPSVVLVSLSLICTTGSKIIATTIVVKNILEN